MDGGDDRTACDCDPAITIDVGLELAEELLEAALLGVLEAWTVCAAFEDAAARVEGFW